MIAFTGIPSLLHPPLQGLWVWRRKKSTYRIYFFWLFDQRNSCVHCFVVLCFFFLNSPLRSPESMYSFASLHTLKIIAIGRWDIKYQNPFLPVGYSLIWKPMLWFRVIHSTNKTLYTACFRLGCEPALFFQCFEDYIRLLSKLPLIVRKIYCLCNKA